jgi:hypothetical protein
VNPVNDDMRQRLLLGLWLTLAAVGAIAFWAGNFGPLQGTEAAGLAVSFGLMGGAYALFNAFGPARELFWPSRPLWAPADADLPPPQRVPSLVEWPYEVVTVPRDGLLDTLERLRAERPGFLPVALGDDSELDAAKETWDADDRSPETILAAAAKQKPLSADVEARRRDPEEDLEVGTWPAELPSYVESLHQFEGLDQVHVVLLPVSDPADAVACLKFGDFNGAPTPERHVAIHRAWQAAYGARLVACTHDTLTLRVDRGPATPEEALALAREVYAYADFDLNDYSELAADLMVTRLWVFWWD